MKHIKAKDTMLGKADTYVFPKFIIMERGGTGMDITING